MHLKQLHRWIISVIALDCGAAKEALFCALNPLYSLIAQLRKHIFAPLSAVCPVVVFGISTGMSLSVTAITDKDAIGMQRQRWNV